MIAPLGLTAAFILDLIVGDPEWSFHPIRLIGRLIARLEALLRTVCPGRMSEKTGGILLVLSVIIFTYSTIWVLLYGAYAINGYCGFSLTAIIVFFSLSLKSLGKAAQAVRRALADNDKAGARKHLANIVGRDTETLSREEMVRATVETVAENTSDGIVAPLFFVLLGGAPLAMSYKAVNTLDSMVGYKDEKYCDFGWASARCDDLANYLPARITGFLLVTGAFLLGKDWRNAMRTMVRDASKHASPNSGYPESAVAGALKIQLGGTNYYGGIARTTHFLGNKGVPLNEHTIGDAVRMMYCASLLMLLLCLLVLRVFG
jgi:adenosylcobinamide-phosphate synthase